MHFLHCIKISSFCRGAVALLHDNPNFSRATGYRTAARIKFNQNYKKKKNNKIKQLIRDQQRAPMGRGRKNFS